MTHKRYSLVVRAAVAVAAITFSLAVSAQAQTEVILHQFTGGRDGLYPNGYLAFDAAGNIYGTAEAGGNLSLCSGTGCGVIFKLSPTSTGGWTETVLHAFAGNFAGGTPASGVIFDSAGNLYGTTYNGGLTTNSCLQNHCGVVYKLSPTSSGGWKETVIHAFQGGSDGSKPASGLVLDAHGNLYGTTFGGGSGNQGVVFQLSPTGTGAWTETILENFSGPNGANPGQLVIDAAGNLYGSAPAGGPSLYGVVFQMTQSGGTWTENILYNFNANLPDAQVPNNVAIDASGNLYGSAYQGGTDNDGAVFELNPSNIVPWPETVIYSFTNSTDGGTPFGNAVVDGKGNVFAASAFGGSGNYGTLIELTPSSSGWSEKTLLSFNGTDGKTPQNLTLDSAGNVYGSTLYGGSHNSGVLFEVTP